jgi:hypothetical protein
MCLVLLTLLLMVSRVVYRKPRRGCSRVVLCSGKCRRSHGESGGGPDVARTRYGKNGQEHCQILCFSSIQVIGHLLRVHAGGGSLLGRIGSSRLVSGGVVGEPFGRGQRLSEVDSGFVFNRRETATVTTLGFVNGAGTRKRSAS